MNLDDYTCRLCWTKCAGPGDLAQHEQQEHDTSYKLNYDPSTYAETK